jgi:hypothetical protein
MISDKIQFQERCDNEDDNTTTLYFTAPKEMLSKIVPTIEYPEAVAMEISIEFPLNHIEANLADVSVSPVDSEKECYDWYDDIILLLSEIEELISLAEKETRGKLEAEWFDLYLNNVDNNRENAELSFISSGLNCCSEKKLAHEVQKLKIEAEKRKI